MKKSDITRLARELRQKQTFEEYVLWQKLRGRRFHGVKFLRQHPIIYDKVGKGFSFFIPDFYTSEKKLIIELDGKVHDFQKEYDKNRDHILKELGLTVLRFKNEEIKDVYSVLENIKMHF